MTVLHFIRDHWVRILAAWFVAGVLLLAIYSVYCALYGETDEQRDLRRRKEKAARAAANLRRNIEYHAAREKARRSSLSDAMIDAAVEIVIADDDQLTRMREAEALNATEYERESDGKRVA